MPKPVRMARYSRPVAAITAEYERSFSANHVAITSPIVVTTRDHPHPPHQPAVAVLDGAVEHRDHADGDQVHDHLERPQRRDRLDQLPDRLAAEARLHEVPVAEQHGVGHRAEERPRRPAGGRDSARSHRRRTTPRRTARSLPRSGPGGRGAGRTRGRRGSSASSESRRRDSTASPVISARRAAARFARDLAVPAYAGIAADVRLEQRDARRQRHRPR